MYLSIKGNSVLFLEHTLLFHLGCLWSMRRGKGDRHFFYFEEGGHFGKEQKIFKLTPNES